MAFVGAGAALAAGTIAVRKARNGRRAIDAPTEEGRANIEGRGAAT